MYQIGDTQMKKIKQESYRYGYPVFKLGLHEEQIAFMIRSKSGRGISKKSISYMQESTVSIVDRIIANLKVIEK